MFYEEKLVSKLSQSDSLTISCESHIVVVSICTFMSREWTQSKVWLLKLFTKVVKQLASGTAEEENTVLQSLLSVVDAEHSPNYSLLLLWASLANAVPVCTLHS